MISYVIKNFSKQVNELEKYGSPETSLQEDFNVWI